MTKKWNMVIDLDLCVNCHNCVLATKDEHIGNDFPGYSAAQPSPGLDTIIIDKHVRGGGTHVDIAYIPKMCGHCDDAPCIKGDTSGAIRKRPDGIVLIDPELARGARNMPELCPYGMIKWDEAGHVPHIWTFDAHLIDAGWEEPRCTNACPTRAMVAVKCSDTEMAAIGQSRGLVTLPVLQGGRQRVHYANAYRMNASLVAGTILEQRNGRTECAAGVVLSLIVDGKEAATVTSDAFGEFRFDKVDPASSSRQIQLKGRDGQVRFVDLAPSGSQVVEIAL